MEPKSKGIYSTFSVVVSQMQPQVHKIAIKGLFTYAAYQILKEKIVLLSLDSKDKKIYLLFDFTNIEGIATDVKKRIKKENLGLTPGIKYILFGLKNFNKNLFQYIIPNVVDSCVYVEQNEYSSMLFVNDLLSKEKVNDLPVGPSAITGLVKMKLQIQEKYLDFVHDKQWAYKDPQGSYLYEIELIDYNVFVSRPSGYIQYNNSLTANVLFDKVLFKMLGHDGKYYRIQDYSNVVKSSMSARRDFTQYIVNNIDRIHLLVFYGLNTYMKAVVNFGKLFHPKFYKVKLANTFEDAMQLILEHKYGKDYFNVEPSPQVLSKVEIPLEEEVLRLKEELQVLKSNQKEKLDKLFHFIGNVLWDSDNDHTLNEIDEESSFSNVFGALNMLKVDIKEVTAERELTIYKLQNQVKEYINEIRKSKKDLQKVLIDKDEFIQALNHELRTPLQSINSTVELVKLSKDEDEKERLLELIDESSKLLNKKITQIKSVSDLKLGKRELSSHIFNLNKAIQSQIDMHESVVQAKNIKLLFDPDHSIPNYLMGDLEKINQILDHFLDNSIKYTNEGIITIRTKLEKDLETQMQIRIEVEDTGIGLDKNIKERLFDDDNLMKSDNGKNSSIGLGLFICKQLVEIMGGDIGYVSEENRGSTFYIVITLNRGTFFKELNLLQRAKSLKGLAPIFSKHKKVLFLSEDEQSKDLIPLMFSKLGLEIKFVNNSEHLLGLLPTKKYDMVFIDGLTPISDYSEVIQKIRLNEADLSPNNSLRIIGLTANPKSSFKEKVIENGYDDIIVKPYTLNGLKTILQKNIP